MSLLAKEFQIRNITVAGFLIFGLIQIRFFEYTKLENGLGYDGGWYIHTAKNIFALTDNYHVLRQFPSFMVWITSKMLQYLSVKYINHVVVFQIYNLIYLAVSIFYIDKIANLLDFKNRKKIFLYILIFSGFFASRESMYLPVMTDICSFMQICALYYYFISKKINLYSILFGLIAFFTNPMPLLIICILGIFSGYRQVKFKKDNTVLYLSVLVFISFNVLFSGILIRHQVFTMWSYPDNAEPKLVYATNFIHSLLFSFLFYIILRKFDVINLLYQYKKINIWFLILFLVVISMIKLIQFAYPVKFAYSLGATILVWSLFINMKPLIGLIDATSYFGIVIPIYLINIREINNFFYQKFALGGVLVSLLGLTFLIKSESRHLLFFLPFMAIGVVHVISQFSEKFLVLSILIALFLSKIWYPLSLAEFDNEQYQQYPAQHYFAFLGPCLAWWPYYLFLTILILVLSVFYFLKNREYFVASSDSLTKSIETD